MILVSIGFGSSVSELWFSFVEELRWWYLFLVVLIDDLGVIGFGISSLGVGMDDEYFEIEVLLDEDEMESEEEVEDDIEFDAFLFFFSFFFWLVVCWFFFILEYDGFSFLFNFLCFFLEYSDDSLLLS